MHPPGDLPEGWPFGDNTLDLECPPDMQDNAGNPTEATPHPHPALVDRAEMRKSSCPLHPKSFPDQVDTSGLYPVGTAR